MRMPRNYPIQQPEFGVYEVPDGWAVWAVFPADTPLAPRVTEFSQWCLERGINLDIARRNRHFDVEYGGIVTDQRLATEFKLTWKSPEFA